MAQKPDSGPLSFSYPSSYSFPPFWTLQPNIPTRQAQLQKWLSFILSYCQFHRLWRLSIVDAVNTPMFHNSKLRRSLSLNEAREIVDWMTRAEGSHRAEWIGKEVEKSSAWIYWRRPEEWADVIHAWIEDTGQKNTVLTLYELTEGEGTILQDFHGMDQEILQKSLSVLIRRGKAQVFGHEDQQGVKFF